MSVKSFTYVNLESSSEEHQNERTPSPLPRTKSFSPPNAPSKSTSSRSTYHTSSSSPSYWIVKVVTSSDLGGAAGHRVYSHAMFDAAISAPTIACCWIIKVVFDLNLGVVERQCVCSHGGFHMPLSESLLS
ncbi:hypothetical protein Tco_1554089 [Tanacetum coccineum]